MGAGMTGWGQDTWDGGRTRGMGVGMTGWGQDTWDGGGNDGMGAGHDTMEAGHDTMEAGHDTMEAGHDTMGERNGSRSVQNETGPPWAEHPQTAAPLSYATLLLPLLPRPYSSFPQHPHVIPPSLTSFPRRRES